MWLTRFTRFLFENPWQTLILVIVISMVPFIGIIGILIAVVITLAKNIREGAILTVASSLAGLVDFYLPAQGPVYFIWIMFGFTALSNLFAWIFAVLLQKRMSFSIVLQIATLIGVLAVSIVHLAYPNVIDWWGKTLLYYYSHAKAIGNNLFVGTPATTSMEDLSGLIDNVKQYATGYVIMLILLSALSTVIIGQWWQAKVFHPGALRRELHYIRLNQLTGLLFIISIILAYWGNRVVIDVMPIVNVLFFAAGLSLIHYFFSLMRSQFALFWLIFFYGILIIGMPVSGVLIVILALTDIWLDFRKRFKTRS